MEDRSLCNIIEHTLEQLAKQENLRIYIATDSQVHKKTIAFATVIVYRYGRRGAHYIYKLEDIAKPPKKKKPIDELVYERLFEEGVRTIDAASILKEAIPALSIESLEFDYNELSKTKSQRLISTMKGWAIGLGFNPTFKCGEMIAIKAGDHICRKKDE